MTNPKKPKSAKEKKLQRMRRMNMNSSKRQKSSIRIDGKLKPIFEKCIRCRKKITHHHVYCDKCWREMKEKSL